MQYKEIKKIDPKFTFVGYSLYNKSKLLMTTTGHTNALVVRNKVKDFEYQKGFMPIEVAYEEIFYCMCEYGATYAFDIECLKRFISIVKEQIPDFYEHIKNEGIDNWQPSSEEEFMVLGIQGKLEFDFDPELN